METPFVNYPVGIPDGEYNARWSGDYIAVLQNHGNREICRYDAAEPLPGQEALLRIEVKNGKIYRRHEFARRMATE